MAKSVVFYGPTKREGGGSLLDYLRKGLHSTKMLRGLKAGNYVAIKLHFGELGNTRYLRPIYARELADLIKECGAHPFLTDTTTLYKQKRHTLFSYLETAARNGYTRETMGCPIVIADGLKGAGAKIKVDNPLKFEEVKVAQAIMEADFLLVLSHLTFHEKVVPAGSIKNVAMGCTTKEAKLRMHASEAHPVLERNRCTGCGLCVRICPGEAITLVKGKAKLEPEKCLGCGDCIAYCPEEAIKVPWASVAAWDVQRGCLDAFRAVTSTFNKGKYRFINLAIDITSHCDCLSYSDFPPFPDLGVFISTDPLAVDKAAYDMVVKSVKKVPPQVRKIISTTNPERFFKAASETGLGNLDYELREI